MFKQSAPSAEAAANRLFRKGITLGVTNKEAPNQECRQAETENNLRLLVIPSIYILPTKKSIHRKIEPKIVSLGRNLAGTAGRR
jgi:hypothetical protein